MKAMLTAEITFQLDVPGDGVDALACAVEQISRQLQAIPSVIRHVLIDVTTEHDRPYDAQSTAYRAATG